MKKRESGVGKRDEICRECLRRRGDGEQRCAGCGADEFVDWSSADPDFVDELRRRVDRRRRRFVLAMEAGAVVLCAGFLFVGLTVARGLGGGAVEWGVKLVTVALLAVCWKLIPLVYRRHLTGRAESRLAELER